MGSFTRLLHTGQPDDLMNEIPTWVAQPLPAEHPDHGWAPGRGLARGGQREGGGRDEPGGSRKGGRAAAGAGRWPRPVLLGSLSPCAALPRPSPPSRSYIVLNRPYALMQWVNVSACHLGSAARLLPA